MGKGPRNEGLLRKWKGCKRNGLHEEVLRKGGLGGTGQDSACQENSEGRNRRGERLWAQVGSAGEAPPFCREGCLETPTSQRTL